MKKKISYFAAALVCAVLMFYGVSAFADANTGAGLSKTVSGTLASVAADSTSLSVTTEQGAQTVPIAKDVWVFRNEQKAGISNLLPGDRVEVVLNSKKQAAYIKAYAAAASPTATPAPTAVPTPAPTPTTTPASTATPGHPSPKATGYPGLEGLNVMIDGPHFKLQLKQNEGKGGVCELNLEAGKGGVVHLKGDDAAAIISQLLSSINLQAPDARQKLLAEIGQHYGIDASKLNVKLDVREDADAKGDDRANDQANDHANDQGKPLPGNVQIQLNGDVHGEQRDQPAIKSAKPEKPEKPEQEHEGRGHGHG